MKCPTNLLIPATGASKKAKGQGLDLTVVMHETRNFITDSDGASELAASRKSTNPIEFVSLLSGHFKSY